jgi:hypothetical protein
LGSVLVREPIETNLNVLPEQKRNEILQHKFAFVCYKEAKSAMRAVNEVPYYKIEDKKYNSELDSLVNTLKSHNLVPEE